MVDLYNWTALPVLRSYLVQLELVKDLYSLSLPNQKYKGLLYALNKGNIF